MVSTLSSSTATLVSVSLKIQRTSPAARTLFFCLPNPFTSLRARSPFASLSNPPSLFASAGVNNSGDAAEDLSILLHVGGMTCEGCGASVKTILENQPQVSSASVNLTTDTAIVWPVPEAMSFPKWRKQLGELLAKHLTSCGFTSNLQERKNLQS